MVGQLTGWARETEAFACFMVLLVELQVLACAAACH